MSRAQAGFADFFPNAPTVLQQKQKKSSQDHQRAGQPQHVLPEAESDTRSSSKTTREPWLPTSQSPGALQHASKEGSSLKRSAHAAFAEGAKDHTEPLSTYNRNAQREDEDITRAESGDLLTGIGSASSLTSTESSVFSNPNTYSTMPSYPISSSHALTPATNTDSSPPPGRTHSPRPAKFPRLEQSRSGSASPFAKHATASSTAITPVHTPPNTRTQVRPGSGELKGFRIVYDPELDPKIHGKERRKLKPRYKNFGEEVRAIVASLSFISNVIVVPDEVLYSGAIHWRQAPLL